MIEKTDDILINKGNGYLIVDKNGDLVKVETNGTRKIYPKTDDNSIATKSYVDEKIGEIGSIIDEINGQEI